MPEWANFQNAMVTYTGADLELAAEVSDHLPVIAWFRTDEEFGDGE